MSNQPRFSNAMSNIDLMSYRAYKNLLNSGNANSTNKSQKSNKNPQIRNYDKFINNEDNKKYSEKNLTNSVFSSQSKRFLWQTDEKINRGSELTGSIKDRRNSDLNSNKWQGLSCKVQEDKYAKYEVPEYNDNNNNNNNKTHSK